MKKLTLYISAANNISFNERDYKNPTIVTIASAEELLKEQQARACRVKRYAGAQFGDDNGRYTARMAANDFAKHAK